MNRIAGVNMCQVGWFMDYGDRKEPFFSTFARASILITNRIYNPIDVLSRPGDA